MSGAIAIEFTYKYTFELPAHTAHAAER